MSSVISETAARLTDRLTGHKFFLLFVFLVAYLIVYPYAASSPGRQYYVFRVMGVMITLLSVYAVSFRRGLIFFALVLAIPPVLQHTVWAHLNAGTLPVVNAFFTFAFDIFVLVVIFRRVFSRETPNAETIFGALCVYLLVGFTFARLYAIMAALQPHAFYLDPATNQHQTPAGFDFIYYSFGTMSSLGASGITAVSPQVRSLSVIQAILGVLYLAVLISRLMGAYRPASRPKQNDESRPT
jgi:hypothetical protein